MAKRPDGLRDVTPLMAKHQSCTLHGIDILHCWMQLMACLGLVAHLEMLWEHIELTKMLAT